MQNNSDYVFDEEKFDRILSELESSRQHNSAIVKANNKSIGKDTAIAGLGIFATGFILFPLVFIAFVVSFIVTLFVSSYFHNAFLLLIPFVLCFILFCAGIILPVMLFVKKHKNINRNTKQNETITTAYQTEIKKKLIGEIIRSFNPSFEYFPEKAISYQQFTAMNVYAAGFLGMHPYKGEDYITGKVGSTKIEMCEFTVGSVSGLFMVAEFNKNFREVTKVLPKIWKKHSMDVPGLLLNGELDFETHGNYADYVGSRDTFGSVKLEEVLTENIPFNEKFDVFSSSQIEARYILSASMMERILAFKKQFNHDMSFVFHESKMYFTINWGANMLEPYSIHQNLHDAKIDLIKQVHQELEYCIRIIEALNLNNELWYSR